MICKEVTYRNFRNIEQANIALSPGVTVFEGDNGQGKTNALEGIYLFAQGRSFRTSRETDLVCFGKEDAAVSLRFESQNREQELSIRWSLPQKRRYCRKNGYPVSKMSEFIGSFRAVIFAPQHLAIVNDGPAVRRSFCDVALSQLEPSYLASLQRFARLLEQRNAYIKKLREKSPQAGFDDTCEILSAQLASESAAIAEKRCAYITKLDAYVKAFFAEMTSGRELPEIFCPQTRSESEYYSLLTRNFDRELRYGATLYGAHKEDVSILLSGKEARSFASQGQGRSIALAMKLAEGEISRDYTGEYPVFLFDDILSELDSHRRSYLLSGITGKQVIITTCTPVPCADRIYEVKDGGYTSFSAEKEAKRLQ